MVAIVVKASEPLFPRHVSQMLEAEKCWILKHSAGLSLYFRAPSPCNPEAIAVGD